MLIIIRREQSSSISMWTWPLSVSSSLFPSSTFSPSLSALSWLTSVNQSLWSKLRLNWGLHLCVRHKCYLYFSRNWFHISLGVYSACSVVIVAHLQCLEKRWSTDHIPACESVSRCPPCQRRYGDSWSCAVHTNYLVECDQTVQLVMSFTSLSWS